MTGTDTPLRAVVSYGHADPGWTPEQATARRNHVVSLVEELRRHGVAADADVFHVNEDWTRWGPRQVLESDFVLIVASQAWVAAWIGSGDELRNRGLRGEADAVRSIEHLGRTAFQQRCRVIVLPGSGDDDIPRGMEGLARYRLSDFDTDSLEPLLRDLTQQPPHELPPLGNVPRFPTSAPPTPASDARGPGAEPTPRAVESNGTASAVVWSAAPPVTVARSDTWARSFHDSITKVVVHLVPAPQKPVSQRVMGGVEVAVANTLRGHLTAYAQLKPSATDDAITVETELVRGSHRDVLASQLLGCRVARIGQVSVWCSLPKDSMGSVLDPDDLTTSVAEALRLGRSVLNAIGVAEHSSVVVAAELAETTLLTDGTLASLGARSSASMRGAMGQPVVMDPEESVPLAALADGTVDEVAATVAGVLIGEWSR